MLLPAEALGGWTAVAVVTALIVRRYPRYWLLWCGLALAAAGAIYLPAVMAHRPPNYYALLEFLVSIVALAGGLVAALVGGFASGRSAPAAPPGDHPTKPAHSPDTRHGSGV